MTLWGAAAIFISGCHHKQLPPQLPPVVLTPNVPPPTPDGPTMKSPPPDSVDTAPPVKVTQVKPKRPPKKTTPKPVAAPEPAPPAEVPANTAAPAVSSVGELSTGGDATPQKQQDAAYLISTSEQRLDALEKTPGQQQSQIRKVRYFLRQAKQALDSGDAEGAKTLATKAKLLMDDLSK